MCLPLLFHLLFRSMTTQSQYLSSNPKAIADDNGRFPWFSLYGGKICFGNRPDTASWAPLLSAKVSHIATVQTRDENAADIRHQCLTSGLKWMWVPFETTSISASIEEAFLHQYLREITTVLKDGAHLYLHCDSTLSRCSLLFYALCHYNRLPSDSAYCALHSINPQANALSRRELKWAASLGHAALKG